MLTITPSPTSDLAVTRYDEAVFPGFRVIFQPPDTTASSIVKHLLHEPEEAAISVVLENLSAKNITALKCRWLVTDTGGKTHPCTHSTDSYSTIPHRPVVVAGARLLVTPSGSVKREFHRRCVQQLERWNDCCLNRGRAIAARHWRT